MKILAIETSCDDTGIAILEISGDKKSPKFNVLANVVASQTEIGKKYGGVFPAMAKREHQKNLAPTFIKALKEAELLKPKKVAFLTAVKKTAISNILEREPELCKKLVPFLKKYKKPDIDLISVTNGPGLEPCLWVGVNFAKALSYIWDIPVVPVNHIESHILVNLLENENIKFPAVALVVSGGHTQIILIEKISKYKILGETRDDAAGECFDKCAKILGLGYPGGPVISKLAEGIKTQKTLPRPMIGTKDYDFSFSGLKTAVLYAWPAFAKSFGEAKQKTAQAMMAAEVQQAIIDVLIKKTIKAVKDFDVKSLILGGGVSANKELRKQFEGELNKTDAFFARAKNASKIKLFVPEPKLSTDNGLMVAVDGYFNRKNTVAWKNISADGNLRIGE